MTGMLAGAAADTAETRPRGWRDRLQTYRTGLIGQALSFGAMVAPIALRENDKLTSLVFTTAIATFLVLPAVLAYPYVFPVLRSERMARLATQATVTVLLLVCLAVLPLSLLEGRFGLPRGTFGVASAMLGAQGLYLVAVTRLVRAGDDRRIGRARLYYGFAVVGFTAVAMLPATGVLSLGMANAAAFLTSALALGLRPTSAARPARRATDRRLLRAYLRRTVAPTVSSIANGWAFLLPGLSLPGLGAAAAPWAVLNRICGGFATVLLTIVGPPLEGDLSRAVRARDQDTFRRVRRLALASGLVVAAVAVLGGLALAVYTSPNTTGLWFWPVALAAVLFWGPLLALSPINRLPNFVGRDRARLCWDAARAVLMTAAFLATDGVTRLVVMGVVVTAFGLLLLPLSRYHGARR